MSWYLPVLLDVLQICSAPHCNSCVIRYVPRAARSCTLYWYSKNVASSSQVIIAVAEEEQAMQQPHRYTAAFSPALVIPETSRSMILEMAVAGEGLEGCKHGSNDKQMRAVVLSPGCWLGCRES